MTFAALSTFAGKFIALRRAIAKPNPLQIGRTRRALRYREKLLHSLLTYWRKRGCPWPIRRALVLKWIAVGSNPQHPYRDEHRFHVARAFLRQVRVFEPATEIPDNIYGRQRNRRGTPYVYSDQEIARLMDAVSQLRLVDALRPLTLYTLIGLLASTGLRIGEAIALTVADVKLETNPPHLLILDSKFGKSRCVVLHPTTAHRLRRYLQKRQEALRGRQADPFFINRFGQRLDYSTQHTAFRRLLRRAGIPRVPGRRGPSLHSLRHTFAVKRLTLWHRERRDVQHLLPHLAVYLGHIGPEKTYWYVSNTPELLQAASARFESQQGKGEPSQ